MAKISVIIPCYNVSLYIDRCLTSVTSQTIGVDSLEIICVDDASTDDTWLKLQDWEQRYPETILLVHCVVNGRQGAARNIGLNYATAPWIGFIDSDDWVEPDYFEKMYQITCQYQVEMVSCQNIRDFSKELHYLDSDHSESKSTGKKDRLIVIDNEEKRRLSIRMMSVNLTAWGKLISREFLMKNQIFFPEQIAYEDNLWGPLLYLYLKCYYVLELSLYHYFVNADSTILQVNADHHMDFLTVQCLKWRECHNRGFFERYQAELEFDFLHACYLDFLKIICLRFDSPPYSMFLLLKEIIMEHVPEYRNNIYFEQGFTEFQHMLLEALYLPIGREQFLQIAESVRKLGI